MLLPTCTESNSPADRIYDAQKESINTIVDVINHVHKRHENTLWILGATVVSPSGQSVLLSGPSQSGKSTTAMALVFEHKWKVLSEDITHVDLSNDEIINFESPFSIKTGAINLLKTAVNSSFENIEENSWLPIGENSLGHNLHAPFDFVFYFDEKHGGDFECRRVSPSELIRAILPRSNVSRSKAASNKIYEYVLQDRCYLVSGGSLTRRLQQIMLLCEEHRAKQNGGAVR